MEEISFLLVSFVILSFLVGLERRLLAIVQWTAATAMAFPQKGESNKWISKVYKGHKTLKSAKIWDYLY